MLNNLLDALKTTSKKVIQKTPEVTSDLIANEVANYSPQNNSEIITNKHIKKIPKERYISPKERLKIIDDLRLT